MELQSCQTGPELNLNWTQQKCNLTVCLIIGKSSIMFITRFTKNIFCGVTQTRTSGESFERCFYCPYLCSCFSVLVKNENGFPRVKSKVKFFVLKKKTFECFYKMKYVESIKCEWVLNYFWREKHSSDMYYDVERAELRYTFFWAWFRFWYRVTQYSHVVISFTLMIYFILFAPVLVSFSDFLLTSELRFRIPESVYWYKIISERLSVVFVLSVDKNCDFYYIED